MEYRLIKKYPGSPKLGTILSSENKTEEWQGTIFYDKYPAYWEKVEEVKYDLPCLSLNDLLSVWGSTYTQDIESYKNSPLFKNFKNLAKSKQ